MIDMQRGHSCPRKIKRGRVTATATTFTDETTSLSSKAQRGAAERSRRTPRLTAAPASSRSFLTMQSRYFDVRDGEYRRACDNAHGSGVLRLQRSSHCTSAQHDRMRVVVRAVTERSPLKKHLLSIRRRLPQASLRRQMPDVVHDLPDLLVVQDPPRSRHSRGRNTVIDNPLQLPIAVSLDCA